MTRWEQSDLDAYNARRNRKAAPKPKVVGRGNKYGNKIVEVDGMRFDSKAEAAHWHELKLREKAGLITNLERQVRYRLDVGEHHICDYVADFRYFDTESRNWVVSDVKGVVTDVFRLKSKLMRALWGVDVQEVSAKRRAANGKRPAPRKRRSRA